MPDLIEFKCPCCGGKLEFNATVQKMKCPYCDSEIDVDELQQNDEALDEPAEESTDAENANGEAANTDNVVWEETAGSEWEDGETDGIKVYSCKSCGGEIVADETTGATSCPYCGNPVVMTASFAGALKPDYVIPFKVTKEQAKDALKKHYEDKKFLPKVFKSENHLDEIKGVYVPFWLFDTVANANMTYEMDALKSWGDTRYNYTETSHYAGCREGTVQFNNVPVDGSSKMPDDMMEAIEPFDFSEAVPFKTAYLSGYMADKYDVDDVASAERAGNRIKTSTEDMFRQTIDNGFSNVRIKESNITLSDSKAKYALYPVWLLTTSFNKTQNLFAVNGQTGKIVGDLPIDKKLVIKYKLIRTLIGGGIAYAALFILGKMGGLL